MSDLKKEFEYFAFISYKREDEKLAKWLQHELEHYRFPVYLKKNNPSLPQKIRPIFRDVSDLSAGVLADEINEALYDSKYLIVVCSPIASQSKWVSKEVQTFIDLGKADKIIPFIIGGTPFSEIPDEECFPSALLELSKEQELLAININDMGRNAAVVKVVARMFDLKFDTLWQRHEREKKKRRIWFSVAALSLCFLAVTGYISKKNKDLIEANEKIARQNEILSLQNEKLSLQSIVLAKNDSLELANETIRLAYDSINIQKKQLLKAYNDLDKSQTNLEKTNADLKEKNIQIKEEKDRVIETNLALTRSNTRAIANEANRLIDEGNISTAIRVLLNVIPDIDSGYDWPYVPEAEYALRRAVDSLQANHWHQECVLEHSLQINTAEFSPDGNYIITASNDNTAKLWDVKSGNTIYAPIEHNRLVNCAIFSPDGKYFATGCRDGFARIFEVPSGKLVHEFEIGGNVWSITYSPDGNYLVCSSSHGLAFCSTPKGEIVARLGRQASVNRYSFTKDGDKFAWFIGPYAMVAKPDNMVANIFPKILESFQNDDETSLMEFLSTATEFQARLDSTQECRYSSLNHDGSRLSVVTYDSIAYLWDTNKGNLLQYTPQALYASFSPNGEYWVTTTSEGTAYVYDVEDGIATEHELYHDDAIISCAFSPDGNLFVTTSLDNTARIWNTENEWELECILQHERPVVSAMFSRDCNSLVSIQDDNTGKIWRIPYPHTQQIKLFLTNAYPSMVTFHPSSNKLLYSSLDRSISEWNIIDGSMIFQSDYYSSRVVSAEYSHDGKQIVAAFDDGLIRILDETGQDKGILMQHNDFLKSAHFSLNDQYVISGSADCTAAIWDAHTGRRLSPFIEHSSRVIDAMFIDDNSIITATADSLFIRFASTGKIISKTKIGNSATQFVALSPNSKMIAACDDNNEIYIWKDLNLELRPLHFAHGGGQMGNYDELYYEMSREVEQPDTAWLKSSISGYVLGGELFRILSHKSSVNSLSFSSDSKYLITNSENCVKVWDVNTGTLISDNMRHPWRLQYSNISSDGKFIASVSNDDENSFLTIWKYLPLDSLISKLKSYFLEWRLTEDEKEKYYLE